MAVEADIPKQVVVETPDLIDGPATHEGFADAIKHFLISSLSCDLDIVPELAKINRDVLLFLSRKSQ